MVYGFLDLLKEKKLSEFNYELLNEGLIKSADYNFTIDKINNLIKNSNIPGICKMYSINDRIYIEINDFDLANKRKFYENFIKLLNNVGYFISNYKINNKLENESIDLITFLNNNFIILYLNKKFDNEVGVPEFLYHVTEKKYIERIRRYGLINKSKKYIDNHPERIYFFNNIKDCEEYIDFKQIITPIILKIDVKTLDKLKLEKDKIKFYEDPKYQPIINAYYTYDNIPPYSIIEF